MRQFIDASPELTDEQVLIKTKKLLGVESEYEVWMNPEFQRFISYDVTQKMLKLFKPKGPAGSTMLLNNVNIDAVMQRWMAGSREMFGKRFKHIPFQMIDFINSSNELSNLDLDELRKSYDCFGVVLNSDVSSGPGKHWFCIYCDLGTSAGQPKSQSQTIDLEYFNSSARPPYVNIICWFEDLRRKYISAGKLGEIQLVPVIKKTIQRSRTECGMWSLMYIKSRLLGFGTDYLTRFNDADMIALRDNIFLS
jgi:hypothetical protein